MRLAWEVPDRTRGHHRDWRSALVFVRPGYAREEGGGKPRRAGAARIGRRLPALSREGGWAGLPQSCGYRVALGPLRLTAATAMGRCRRPP